jgi:hypothetical protein
MSEHELEKLLGGFAADTLTAEEKQTLYTAALQDQQLFNALADEQALKELLSDQDVRRRLLTSLQQESASGAGGSLSWLDWFRRPAGLAFAGGLATAALALVLGIRIYQDSLRPAAQSVVTEDAKPASPPAPMPPASQPATPQAVEPQVKAKENVPPAIELPKKDTSIDKLAKRERSVEEVTSPADQKLATSSAPPATAPEPKQIQTSAGEGVAATVTPALSARALFFGGEPGRADTRLMAKEQEQAMKPLAESVPQENRPERPLQGLSQLGKAAGTTTQLRPLGLRYSFVVRGTDGQEREVDAATASKSIQSIFLTVEANQDAYLQIWETVGSSTPQLLWPEKETARTSPKITAGQRLHIPLPMERRPVTFTARLSRVPPRPTTRHEAVMSDRLSPNQFQESITASNQPGSQEHATYVVNQDPTTTAQVAVDMTLSR